MSAKWVQERRNKDREERFGTYAAKDWRSGSLVLEETNTVGVIPDAQKDSVTSVQVEITAIGVTRAPEDSATSVQAEIDTVGVTRAPDAPRVGKVIDTVGVMPHVQGKDGAPHVGKGGMMGAAGESLRSAADFVREPVKFRRSETLELYLSTPPPAGDQTLWLRWYVANLVESNLIRTTIISAIVLNAVVVGIYANKEMSKATYDWLDWCFTLGFLGEMVMKLVGYYELFFHDPWNNYDFAIVSFGLIDKIVMAFPMDATIGRIVRILRVFRFFRVVSAFQSLNKLVVALAVSIGEVAILQIIQLIRSKRGEYQQEREGERERERGERERERENLGFTLDLNFLR